MKGSKSLFSDIYFDRLICKGKTDCLTIMSYLFKIIVQFLFFSQEKYKINSRISFGRVKSFKYFFSLFCFITIHGLILVNCSPAQTLSFRNYNMEHGLSQSHISAIHQDKDGYIWFSAFEGVYRFDGQIFESFTIKDGLAANHISAGCMDKMGDIWFGHYNGLISKYNPKLKRIEKFQSAEGLPGKKILTIFEDKKGNIWFGTRGEGVFKYDGKTFKAITTKEGLNNDNVYAICQDNNDVLWFGTNKGITRYDPSRSPFDQSLEYITVRDGLPGNQISFLLNDSNGDIWIGTYNAGLSKCFHLNLESNKKIFTNFSAKEGLTNNRIQAIYEDNTGNIWVGVFGGGVAKYIPYVSKRGKGYFKTIKGLCNNSVVSILQDREGNIWFGTQTSGVYQYRGEMFELYGTNEGIINKSIWSILEDTQGNFWFATENGLTKYTYKKEESASVIKHYNTANGLTANFIVSLCEDDNGFIWIGTFGGGVCRLDPKTNKLKVFTKKDGIGSNVVLSITADKKGFLWFGCDSGGISRYNTQLSIFEDFSPKHGLSGSIINPLWIDSGGNLWFVTDDGGLIKYDRKKFENISGKHGLKFPSFRCITEDKNGNLWIGSKDFGLYKFDGKAFLNYTKKDGLSGYTVFFLICDNNNNIWIGTNTGVDKFNIKDTIFTHYGKLEGFLGGEANQNAAFKDRKGNLWFGGISGAVKYNPQNENKLNSIEPLTHITKLQIFQKDTLMLPNARFSHNENYMKFYFTGISLSIPEKVRYQYKLEGFDNAWSPVTKERYAVYSNLPFGEYSFKVKACNNDGVWNKKPVVYQFEILRPFWLAWQFILIIGLAFLSLIYILIEYRFKIYKREKTDLEKVIEIETFGRKKTAENYYDKDSYDYKIYFFGGLKIVDKKGKEISRKWRTAKIKSIFCYLIENKEKRIIKDILIDNFWHDHDVEKASTSLYNAIHFIRKVFFAPKKGSFILTANKRYYVNPNYRIYVDTDEYNKRLDLAKEFEKAGKIDEQIKLYRQAAAVYRGEFLEGIYDNWSEEIRNYYNEKYKKVLSNLIDYYFNSDNYKECLGFCERMVEIDRFEEQAYFNMIKCYDKLGDKSAAKKQSQIYEDIHKSEYGDNLH